MVKLYRYVASGNMCNEFRFKSAATYLHSQNCHSTADFISSISSVSLLWLVVWGVISTFMLLQDFVDAFEKLLRLELKNTQEREIITVILECSANERSYNAYYTHLLSKFLTYHRNYLVRIYICGPFLLIMCAFDSFKKGCFIKQISALMGVAPLLVGQPIETWYTLQHDLV